MQPTGNISPSSLSVLIVGISAVAIGLMLSAWPIAVVVLFVVLFILPIVYHYQRNLRFWQLLVSVGTIAYASLNYGFANFSPGAFFGIPVGHLILSFALLLVMMQSKKLHRELFSEPITWLSILLFFLSLCHLILDVPAKGMYAIRDANYAFEILFGICGYLWAARYYNDQSFFKFLLALFIVTFVYSLTYPFKDLLVQYSPVSGLFREVPLLGSYAAVTFYLVLGGLFCFIVAPGIWPKYVHIFYALGVLQIIWSLIFQERSMYLGLAIGIVLITFFSKVRLLFKVSIIGIISILAMFLVVDLFNLEVKGRVGELSSDFFLEHIKSIFLTGESIGVDTSRWRIELWISVIESWRASFSTIVFGLGFGDPLVNFLMPGGVEVRQPHNTHITVLARMGLIGFLVWALIFCRVLYLLIKAFRMSKGKILEKNIVLWFMLFYMLSFILSSVQPWLEFSYGAVPFFILMGFAVGWSNKFISSCIKQDDMLAQEGSVKT